jgi:hypothetical protein
MSHHEPELETLAPGRNEASSTAALAGHARAQQPAAVWLSRSRRRDVDPPPEQGGSNRSLSFARSAQRFRAPTSIGGAGTAKRGGAESAPSSHASIRGCSHKYSVE